MNPAAEHITTVRNDTLIGAIFVLPVAGDNRRVGATAANAGERLS